MRKWIVYGLELVSLLWLGSATWQNFQFAKHTHTQFVINDQHLKLDLQRIKEVKRIKPTVKTVSTNYQRAMSVSKQFLHYQNVLHQQSDPGSKQAHIALQQINNLVVNPGQLVNPLLPSQFNGFTTEINYGGQSDDNKIAMAYRYYDRHHQLMQLVMFDYFTDTHKLGQFVIFPTYTMQKLNQQTFADKE